MATGDRSTAVALHIDKLALELAETTLTRNPPIKPWGLPAGLPDFEGRSDEIKELMIRLTKTGGRVGIVGMPGLGKTELAVHVGHQLAKHYSDGQLFVNLAGLSDRPTTTSEALTHLIRSIEPAKTLQDNQEDLGTSYRTMLRGKCALIVLDNARDANQVRPLIPPETCGMIVTSRRAISIAGLASVELDLMTLNEAAKLLRAILKPNPPKLPELRRLAQLCDRLPLALRVAAEFLKSHPNWTAQNLIDALEGEQDRLARFRFEGDATLDVAAILSLSVRELRNQSADLADRWHELAVFAGSFDLAAAAAIWRKSESEARDLMTPILARSMLLYDRASSRYRMHDLMRDLANGRGGVISAVERNTLDDLLEDARRLYSEYYCRVLTVADEMYVGGDTRSQSLALFDQEIRNILAGQSWAATRAQVDARARELHDAYSTGGAHILPARHAVGAHFQWSEVAIQVAREIGDR